VKEEPAGGYKLAGKVRQPAELDVVAQEEQMALVWFLVPLLLIQDTGREPELPAGHIVS
jgi:hypothetical protein